MWKNTALGVVAAGALTIGLAGGALALDADSSTAGRVASDAVVAPPPGPGNQGAAHQTSSSALRAHLAAGGGSYLDGVDWASARSFAIPGTRLRGWTFDQPGKRCLAMPDPISEGYGVTCQTPDAVAAGKASVVVLPPADAGAPNVVGVLVSGNHTASIEGAAGAAASWERIGDVYAGTAPAGSRLVTAAGSKGINPPASGFVPPATRP
ncbi:MAG TPA: hypothetical protein VF587_09050 [Solirubrobacteraceae bacterium]|jgi:hypothetical protein